MSDQERISKTYKCPSCGYEMSELQIKGIRLTHCPMCPERGVGTPAHLHEFTKKKHTPHI